jgi:twitching motility protein PilT
VTVKKEDHLFGRLALHYDLVTRDQINEALREQSQEGGARKVGEILIERGWLSRERFEQLLRIQRKVQAQEQDREQTRDPARERPRDEPRPGAEEPGRSRAPEERQTPGASPAAGSVAGGEPSSLDGWLRLAADRGASDLHVHSGQRVKLRIAGELTEASAGPLDAEGAEALLRDALNVAQREELDRDGQVELAATVPEIGRYRGSVYRQQQGVDGVFRLIPRRPPSLSDLGLPLDLARLANFHQGLVLVTGPAGCGKSATLAALVDIVNRERPEHVVTIEDPVEVVHRSRRSIVNQRQVGRHTGSFDRALRAALREDPDVIVVGELRDLETISLALTAAETGHLVLATLHTTSAISTINRLVGVFPPNQQAQIRAMASESLRAIVCQRLARRADGKGRVPALEILLVTNAVSNLIRDNKTFQIRSVLQTGSSKGMRMLDGSLEELVRQGTITAEEAQLHAENPERFRPDRGGPAGGTS